MHQNCSNRPYGNVHIRRCGRHQARIGFWRKQTKRRRSRGRGSARFVVPLLPSRPGNLSVLTTRRSRAAISTLIAARPQSV